MPTKYSFKEYQTKTKQITITWFILLVIREIAEVTFKILFKKKVNCCGDMQTLTCFLVRINTIILACLFRITLVERSFQFHL